MSSATTDDDFETIRETYLDRLDVQVAESTVASYDRAIRKWWIWLHENYDDPDLWDVDNATMRAYVSDLLNEDYKVDTIKGRRAGVGKFYEIVPRLIEEGQLDVGIDADEIVNPNEGLDLSGWKALQADTKQEQELGEDFYYLTPAEKENLIDNLPSPQLRNELMVRLLYQTGLRQGELSRCRLSDIDRGIRSITVRSSSAKNDERRTSYYRESLDFLMDQWIDGGHRDSVAKAPESRYLFPTVNSERIKRTQINLIVREAAEKAGLQEVLYVDNQGHERVKVTAHALRHSFAVQSLLNGMDLKTLQELMGHKNLETTEQYLKVIEQHRRRIAAQRGAGVETVHDDGSVSRPNADRNGEERELIDRDTPAMGDQR